MKARSNGYLLFGLPIVRARWILDLGKEMTVDEFAAILRDHMNPLF